MASRKPRSFQEIILRLQSYWSEQGCAIMQPYDMEVGAGTFHAVGIAQDPRLTRTSRMNIRRAGVEMPAALDLADRVALTAGSMRRIRRGLVLRRIDDHAVVIVK